MTQELDALKATTTWPNPFLDKRIHPDWSNTHERKQIEMLFGTRRAHISAQVSALIERAEIAREFNALSSDHGLRVRRLRNPEAS